MISQKTLSECDCDALISVEVIDPANGLFDEVRRIQHGNNPESSLILPMKDYLAMWHAEFRDLLYEWLDSIHEYEAARG